MCLAVPAKIIEITDDLATVEIKNVQRKASLMLLEDAKIGDYILVHAGFAVEKIALEEVHLMEGLRAEMQGQGRSIF